MMTKYMARPLSLRTETNKENNMNDDITKIIVFLVVFRNDRGGLILYKILIQARNGRYSTVTIRLVLFFKLMNF